jgi:acyl-CoA synthetase (AMP-forming)/AMP-acid ligase II/thioesterase domain-containing protein
VESSARTRRPAAPEPRAATIRDLVDAAATRRGDGAFLLEPDTGCTLSFAALRDRCIELSHWLLDRVAAGDKIALAADNGRIAVEVLLGAMYGGLVSVPLNLAAGDEALATALGHSDAAIVIAAEEHRDRLASIASGLGRAIDVVPAPDAGAASGRRPLPPVGAADDALLIYTSGSVGRPKGVLHTHGSLVACGENAVAAHVIGPLDRFLCVLPLYHMNSLDKLAGTLASGGAMILPRRFDAARFWGWIEEHRCTWTALVPTIVSHLLRRKEPGAAAARLASLRFARCSSAPLREEECRAFEQRFGVPLLEGMGMTEAGGIFLNPVPPRPRKRGSLGLAHGLEARIADENGAPCETGEIEVRGASVMKGYYKDARATAAAVREAGWLRTGDRGRRDEDGFFFHAGRRKELIIKAGTNIAPREIEECLERHSAVAEAAVVGVADPLLGEDIVAFAVLTRDGGAGEPELIEHCAAHLGALRSPAAVIIAADLPRGPSGKILRADLAARAAGARVGHAAPHHGLARSVRQRGAEDAARGPTPLETLIARLWSEVLGVEEPGIDADFFALGGYSLLALQLLLDVRRHTGVDIPLAVFVEAPTIRKQALLVSEWTPPTPGVAERDPVAVESRGRDRAKEAGATLLAPVRTDGSRPPLFCVYGPSRYQPLAKRLGPEQPAYGVFSERELSLLSGPASQESFYPSVEELAALYLRQARAVQPHGPYQLAGSSFGGRVALEMAQTLRAEGEEVALLAVLDTLMPGATEWLPLRWFAHHAERSLRLGPVYLVRALRERLYRHGFGVEASLRDERVRGALRARMRDVELRRRARAAHRVRPYDGRVVLFRAAEPLQHSPGYRVDPTLGWSVIARGGLDVHEVPGTHLGMLREPEVAELAQRMRPYLIGNDSTG